MTTWINNGYGTIPLERDCCTKNPLVTERERMQIEFWEAVRNNTYSIFNNITSEQVYGKTSNKMCLLKLYHRIAFFLDNIYEKRYMDSINDGDEGNEYYIDLYCIETIKKALLCRGIDSNTIKKMFHIYSLDNDTDDTEGVGYDHIENTNPILEIY